MTKGSTPANTEFNLERLIGRYQAGIWRYLRVLGCEPNLADDLTQETFLAVLKKPFDDYGHATTAAYLRRVAYNLFITSHRRSARVTLVENVEELDSTWQAWALEDGGEAAIDALKHCLATLTERARFALELRFREKRSRNEIAAALEITPDGAKNLMQRAKAKLRGCVENKLQ